MFTLAPVAPDDLPWLFELHKAALKEYVEQIWGWDEAWQRDYFFKTLNLADSRLILLGEERIGRLTVEEKPDHIFLAYIALLPAHQGKGIGTEVIRSVMAEAKEKGKPVILSVLKPNPAKALYERLGFIITTSDNVRTELSYGQPFKR